MSADLKIKRSNEIFSLHKYFLAVDELKRLREKILHEKEKYSNHQIFEITYFVYASLYYSALYVVIEGWETLKLKDMKIDKLLENIRNKKLLKRYRNATFHFHKNYYDKKFTNLYSETSIVIWIQELFDGFSEYFLTFFAKYKNTN